MNVAVIFLYDPNRLLKTGILFASFKDILLLDDKICTLRNMQEKKKGSPTMLSKLIFKGSSENLQKIWKHWPYNSNGISYCLRNKYFLVGLVPSANGSDAASNPSQENEDIFPGVKRYSKLEDVLVEHQDLQFFFDLDPPAKECLISLPASVYRLGLSFALGFLQFLSHTSNDSLEHGYQSWNLFLSTLSRIEDALFLLDDSYTIIELNDHASKSLEMIKGEIKGKSFVGLIRSSVLDDESSEKILSPINETIRTGKGSEGLFSNLDNEGKQHRYRMYTYPVKNVQEKVEYIVVLLRDITAVVQKGRRRVQSEKFIALKELSVYLAHELRNPLSILAGFSKMLLRSPSLSEKDKERVNILVEESIRMETILGTIITFSQVPDSIPGEANVLEAVRQALASEDLWKAIDKEKLKAIKTKTIAEHQPLELEGLEGAIAKWDFEAIKAKATAEQLLKLEELIKAIDKEKLEALKDKVTIDVSESLPKVGCNLETLEKCFVNILQNAFEAVDEQEDGKISVCASLLSDFVLLEIKDNGPGLDPERIDMLYNPFFSTKNKGSGLGLPITKKILDEMDGRIELESDGESWTNVKLYLPLVQASSETAEDAPLVKPSGRSKNIFWNS